MRQDFTPGRGHGRRLYVLLGCLSEVQKGDGPRYCSGAPGLPGQAAREASGKRVDMLGQPTIKTGKPLLTTLPWGPGDKECPGEGH